MTELPKIEDIQLFITSARGGGRETNDAKNTAREKVLEHLLTLPRNYFQDAEHGPHWLNLKTKWTEALATIFQLSPGAEAAIIAITRKGGRGFNYDFLASLVSSGRAPAVQAKIEFKHGGTRLAALPEFFNPAADKPLHPTSYARFFYANYLQQITDVYPSMSITATPPPTEEDYARTVHQASYTKHPFYTALYNAEKEGTKEQYKEKNAIVKKSIEEFLTLVKDQTNLAYLTEEFQRSQEGKHFLLWNNGDFHYDSLKPEELIADRVLGIRNGNLLVIASRHPGTTFELLLRWKNHIGILYPAWQISMKREKE